MTQMRAAKFRAELFVEEMPAPQRIAPFASALSADVTVDGEDVGSGRIVVLHDPAGNDAWHGTFRCVAYARAEIDPELVSDPLLAGVGWSWLTEALEAHGAAYAVPSGSVTCVSSESFGGMADEPATAQLEIRASWSPDRRPHPARRGLGRAAVHGGRAAAGARGRRHDALPTRATWPADVGVEDRRSPSPRTRAPTRLRRPRRAGSAAGARC